jgi:hypothetical protein
MPVCGEGITFCLLLSTNLMPLCGEAFHFWTFLLRTLCRYAAKQIIFVPIYPSNLQRHQRLQDISGLYFPFRPSASSASSGHQRFVFPLPPFSVISVIRTSAVCIPPSALSLSLLL